MTNRETPHDEIKTLHETFANAACPKQNAHDEIDLTAAVAGREALPFGTNFPVWVSEFSGTP